MAELQAELLRTALGPADNDGEMLGDDVKVRYVRDWDLDGVKFRTTWSAGYYLQDLVRRRPYLLAAEDAGFQDLI